MFSQSSFRTVESDRPLFDLYNQSPGDSTLVTPTTSAQISPLKEEDELRLDTKNNEETILQPVPKLHIPTDQQLQSNMSSSPRRTHKSSGSIDRQFSKSLHDDSLLERPTNRTARLSPSPSRPHLNALSPLQGLSPLHTARPLCEQNANATPLESGRRRANSLTRSLSRRQSLIASAEEWSKRRDEEYHDPRGDAMNLFSRITLVKAPAEQSNLRRAKSSSSISPFAAGRSIESNTSATTARGPRRSFAASSFAGFSPLAAPSSPKSLQGPFSPHGPDTAGRITHRHDRSGGDAAGVQRKTMSPEEVLDVARGLASPVVIPEGGFKGAELKRRKSAGAVSRRGTMESPEKPPLALEPVEYVQLDEDTLLPFVERPQEVNELMHHPSNAPLFKLLKAAFPKDPAREHWQALPPEQWCWDEFVRHLTTLRRSDCPDYAWIFRARQAVRARSVALWEKLGLCLGCDGDLLNAGGDDGSPPSWAGLSLGEEGEYDPSANQVWIEGLQGIDPEEAARIERQLKEEFGDIVEDEGEQAAAGMTALLGTVGEEPEEVSPNPRQTTAQREADRKRNPVDPMDSPTFTMGSLPRDMSHSPYTPQSPARFESTTKPRSKSFVGLQILTSPIASNGSFGKYAMHSPHLGHEELPVYDRGPGSPLFPSSFSSLSVEPNLGRSASVALPAGKAKPIATAFGGDGIGMGMDTARWGGIRRKASGAGLSESAITFASESDYSHSAPGDHDRHL